MSDMDDFRRQLENREIPPSMPITRGLREFILAQSDPKTDSERVNLSGQMAGIAMWSVWQLEERLARIEERFA